MLDILGAMALTTIAILCATALILTGTQDNRKRRGLVWLFAAWFVTIATLGALGVFGPKGLGVLGIGSAIVIPLLASSIAFRSSSSWRAFVLGVPLAVLVAMHTGRLLGAFFLALHEAGRLPPTFAHTAGWGDIFVGALAAPLAWAIHRRTPGWRPLALAWNSVALFDLVTAVSLGVGSAPNSPLRFIFESPNSGAVGTLPWVMIPGFLVPLYMLTHLAIFAQLAASVPARRDGANLRVQQAGSRL